jgi:hypothetical protein
MPVPRPGAVGAVSLGAVGLGRSAVALKRVLVLMARGLESNYCLSL